MIFFGSQNCVCAAGYYSPTGPGGACTRCPENTYCPWNSTAPTPCTPFSHSTVGQRSVEFCHCNAGYYGRADLLSGTCVECPRDSFCVDGNNNVTTGNCTSFASSAPRSPDVSFCTCNEGYFGSAWLGQPCTQCVSGRYTNALSNASVCTACLAGSASQR